MPPEQLGTPVLRRKQVLDLLNISHTTLYDWVRTGRFPAPIACPWPQQQSLAPERGRRVSSPNARPRAMTSTSSSRLSKRGASNMALMAVTASNYLKYSGRIGE